MDEYIVYIYKDPNAEEPLRVLTFTLASDADEAADAFIDLTDFTVHRSWGLYG